jgi:hypothetical protein
MTITRIVSSPLICGGMSACLSSISLLHAIPNAKPLGTFAGIALKRVAIFQIRPPRFRLLFSYVVIAKPLRTFARHALETDEQSRGRHFLPRFF